MERNDEQTGMTPGTSEVHSEMRTQPSKGVGNSGSYDAGAASTAERARERVEDARDAVTDRVDEAREEITDRIDDLRGRTREKVDSARSEAARLRGEMTDRANRVLDQTGARARVQEYPLFALGAAFGLGYLLAGSGSEKGGVRGKVRTQVRAAIVTGVAAAAAQQARSLLGMESGQGGSVGDLLGSAFGSGESGGTTAAGGGNREASAYGA